MIVVVFVAAVVVVIMFLTSQPCVVISFSNGKRGIEHMTFLFEGCTKEKELSFLSTCLPTLKEIKPNIGMWVGIFFKLM